MTQVLSIGMKGTHMSRPTTKTYEPQQIETKWYGYWMEKGFFHPEVPSDKQPFCIVLPPPNVTGVLHMGHALTATIQDSIVRWRRMAGDNALWLPGTDHAGIATQVIVERQLRKEGLSRHDIGREKFLERVWKWKDEHGRRIGEQHKPCLFRHLRPSSHGGNPGHPERRPALTLPPQRRHGQRKNQSVLFVLLPLLL